MPGAWRQGIEGSSSRPQRLGVGEPGFVPELQQLTASECARRWMVQYGRQGPTTSRCRETLTAALHLCRYLSEIMVSVLTAGDKNYGDL